MRKNKKLIITAVSALLVLITGGVFAYLTLKPTAPLAPVATAPPLSHHQLDEVKATLLQLLEDEDAQASLAYLRSAIENDTSLARECHPILHHLGRAAYEKYRDFSKTISYQDGLCNSGYTHGAIEGHFSASEDVQASLKTTCPSDSGAITFQLWQCYHGIGHGVMYYTSKDLPESLALCNNLNTDFARSSCENGAFMERFVIVSHSGAHAKHASDVTMNLCTVQAATHKSDCYFYAPTAYLERHPNDYAGAFKECETAEADYIGSCIAGVGGQAMKENATKPEIAREVCKQAPGKYETSCMSGAISLLINHYGATTSVEPLCKSTFATFEDLCSSKVTAWNESFNS